MRPVEIIPIGSHSEIKVPMAEALVAAGFPSPADDYIEHRLDLNEFLIDHPAATFFVRVQGQSMREANIHSGDILIVDRSLEAKDGKIVVAVVGGEFTVKRLRIEGNRKALLPENPAYPILEIHPGIELEIWGVVTYVIHPAR
jgi:DNA polymerase V